MIDDRKANAPHEESWERADFLSRLVTIDHIRPRGKGGTNTPDNRRLCCAACNSAKGSRFVLAEQRETPETERVRLLAFVRRMERHYELTSEAMLFRVSRGTLRLTREVAMWRLKYTRLRELEWIREELTRSGGSPGGLPGEGPLSGQDDPDGAVG